MGRGVLGGADDLVIFSHVPRSGVVHRHGAAARMQQRSRARDNTSRVRREQSLRRNDLLCGKIHALFLKRKMVVCHQAHLCIRVGARALNAGRNERGGETPASNAAAAGLVVRRSCRRLSARGAVVMFASIQPPRKPPEKKKTNQNQTTGTHSLSLTHTTSTSL